MEKFIQDFLIVTGVQMLGLMSPGPDFAMVTKMAISHGRRIGVYTALGIMCGIAVHVGYSLLGIGWLMTQSILLFTIVKYIGAAYLVYIGVKALFSKKPAKGSQSESEEKPVSIISPAKATRIGFLTNVLNPKATLFMFSLFTQVIGPNTAALNQFAYGIMILATTFMWFGFLAFVLSHNSIRSRIHKVQHYVERSMGAVLIALGIKVALPDK